MSTFSQVVDELMVELVRPDLFVQIASYLNQAIREVHMHEQSQLPIYYESNRLEAEGTVASLPALWTIPNIPRFQAFETLYYPEFGVYARKRAPSRLHLDRFSNSPYTWYRTGPQIAMSGLPVGGMFTLSYFEYPRQLVYLYAAQRPATWNEQTQAFTYNTVGVTDYNLTAESRALAEELTTNWLLLRWKEMLKQGVRNKIYVRLGEEPRARMTYSIYSGLRSQCVNAESMELQAEYGEGV